MKCYAFRITSGIHNPLLKFILPLDYLGSYNTIGKRDQKLGCL
jgi:hypothetical protein